MLNCKQFARQVATATVPLSKTSDPLGFWAHYVICPFCRRYWREIRALGEIQKANAALPRHPAVQLHAVKDRLRQELRRRFL
jgi:hypothetical protein